jgi:signal peptidase II
MKKLSPSFKKRFLITLVTVLTFDLLTKYWAITTLKLTPWQPTSWFELGFVENHGIAFGLPFGGSPLIVLSILLLFGFWIYARKALDLNQLSVTMGVSLILSGAVGNLVDRIFLGFVRDFIRIGSWPLFNIADSAIVIGLILLLLSEFLPSHVRNK